MGITRLALKDLISSKPIGDRATIRVDPAQGLVISLPGAISPITIPAADLTEDWQEVMPGVQIRRVNAKIIEVMQPA